MVAIFEPKGAQSEVPMTVTNHKWSKAAENRRSPRKPASPGLRHWRESVAFYHRNKSRLLKNARYAGKFVAVRHRRIVDVDADQRALASRLLKRFPDQVYFVAQVRERERVYDVPSFVSVR
jgi:hypothetical protein